MPYRTYVNEIQIFGNNDRHDEWLEFIKHSGIKIDENGRYEGYITDFAGAMRACENVVMAIEDNMEKERAKIIKNAHEPQSPEQTKPQQELEQSVSSLFDLTDIKESLQEDAKHQDLMFKEPLFARLKALLDNGELFLPIRLYNTCKNDLQLDLASEYIGDYKLKSGCKIHVKAG